MKMTPLRWTLIGLAIAAVVGGFYMLGRAPIFASPPAFSETAITARIEVWTFWMLVVGAVSAIASGLSVAALVWTFREQRKSTHAQERGFLELKIVSVKEGARTLDFEFEVRNTGRTRATFISVTPTLHIYEPGESEAREGRMLCPWRGNIASGETQVLAGWAVASDFERAEITDVATVAIPARAHWGTLELNYEDIFDGQHTIRLMFHIIRDAEGKYKIR